MKDKYQESIDLFEQIYFDEDGKLKFSNISELARDSREYWDLGKDTSFIGDYKSKIVGRSFFTPRIERKPIVNKLNRLDVLGYKYFLTLDHQGRFDHHFDQFLQTNSNCIKEIDIANMTREEVMTKVREILHMSNEEVMELFNIQSTCSTKVKLELLVDDIIHSYFEQKGQEITEKTGGPEWGMRIETANGYVEQISRGYDTESPSSICISQEDSAPGHGKDDIVYKVLTPKETDLSKIRISFDDRTKVSSELGKLIYTKLRDRFTERQIEENAQLEAGNLEDLTNEQLEEHLQTIQADIEGKREKLRRIELINEIVNAQQEGLKLDDQIRKAKVNNRGE